MKTNLTGKECFERTKKSIVIPQEYNKNWTKIKTDTDPELMILSSELKKKEENIYNELVKEYILSAK